MMGLPVMGSFLQWVSRGSYSVPDFFGPALFPGYMATVSGDLRILGLVLTIAALLWGVWKWLNRPGFWSGTMIVVLGLRLLGSAVTTWQVSSAGDSTATLLATLLAGPVAGIYLWSLLLYALFKIMRTIRPASQVTPAPLMRISWGPFTGVLTTLAALAVPLGMLWATTRGLEVIGPAWSLAAQWNPPVYTLLAFGYGTLFRRTEEKKFRWMAWILALSAMGGWSHWTIRFPLTADAVPGFWPSGLVILATIQALLWFPACGGFGRARFPARWDR